MNIPSPLPLDDFERAIQADPEVLAVFYFGSLGRGAAGRFSDLDIYVCVPDEIAEPYPGKFLSLLKHFGEFHWLEIGHGTGFMGPEWIQTDIEIERRSEMQPSPRFAGATVIKDTDGLLAAFLAECQPEQIVETPASASAVICGAIFDQLFLARHNARGAVWSARGNITHHSCQLYELLGRLRGRRTYGYRYAEELLTSEEQALIAEAWPCEVTREENRRAARALWFWTKHVWREAEHVIGQPLGIELDETGMLAAIDRMYE
jgi:predicted nucleotidyltransferase